MRMNQQQTDSLHIVVWCGIILIRILSEFQPRTGSDIAVKNCHNLSHRRMVQELLTSNDKVAQFHHQGALKISSCTNGVVWFDLRFATATVKLAT